MIKYRVSRRIVLALLGVVLLANCASSPTSFTKGEQDWSIIELREGIEYEDAWEQIVDLLARRFDIEMVEKESGYLRTSWNFTWWQVGERTENYRVRAIAKFTPDKSALAIKAEAHYLDRLRGGWVTGADSLLMNTLKTDIMGTVGRTTR